MEDLDEELLPPGLNGVLGDYLVNGQFGANNVDLNFFAPVLGPDINFG